VIVDLSQAQRDAIRESIGRFLAEDPGRDDRGREVFLLEVQSAIRMYLSPPDTEPRPGEEVRDAEHVTQEFELLAKRADSLVTAIESLDEYSRSRLVDTTQLDAAALDSLTHLSDLAASEARSAARKRSGGQLPVSANSKNPEIELVEKLSIVWTRHTQEQIVRDREAEGPWARFVELTCSLAGIDRGAAHRIRIRVYDSSTLDESAEILASIPDL
jgi:hypothetical protein